MSRTARSPRREKSAFGPKPTLRRPSINSASSRSRNSTLAELSLFNRRRHGNSKRTVGGVPTASRRLTMSKTTMIALGAGVVTALAIGASAVLWAGGEGHLDAGKIGQAAGTKATTTKDGVVRLAWPRTDVKVTVDGMAFP